MFILQSAVKWRAIKQGMSVHKTCSKHANKAVSIKTTHTWNCSKFMWLCVFSIKLSDETSLGG